MNALWECMHLPLYADYQQMGEGLPLVLIATSGDVLYVLLIAFVIKMTIRGPEWLHLVRTRHYLLAAFLGFLVALFVEYKALYLHRWAYSSLMPVIPFFGVGLSPVLQMMVLAPLTIYLSRGAMRVWRNKNARS